MLPSIICFGSLNIDHVYLVPHFAEPGETLSSHDYQQFVGGKGLNQSIALARAGVDVSHAGCIGREGAVLRQTLRDNGVAVEHVIEIDAPSGHAIIQVNAAGENCITLHGGANQCVDLDFISRVLYPVGQGDWLLLQNEINNIAAIIDCASQRQMMIAFNPAPMSEQVVQYPLEKVDLLILNQTEAAALTRHQRVDDILGHLRQHYPGIKVLLTLGQEGALYQDAEQTIKVDASPAEAVDTTAAGDTFIGYFIADLCRGSTIQQCMEIAARAAAKCVERPGAANSIPYRTEIEAPRKQ